MLVLMLVLGLVPAVVAVRILPVTVIAVVSLMGVAIIYLKGGIEREIWRHTRASSACCVAITSVPPWTL